MTLEKATNSQFFVKTLDNFIGGLNTIDSTLSMPENKLRIAKNVLYETTGEVRSIFGFKQLGNDITVNSLPATKILGGVKFNNTFYLMASNGVVARLVYYNVAGGNIWSEIDLLAPTNFDKDAETHFSVYQNKLWFVNGKTTGGNILHFLDTSHAITGLSTTTGLEAGINRICLHLERIWISKGNKIFISKQYPVGDANDWDAGSVYSGSNTAGVIQLDDNTEDEILQMVTQFGQLVVFRKESIHVVSGHTILNSTIQKAFNARGVFAHRSISRADANIYFMSNEGVKVFSGVTVMEAKTEVDNISTVTIDRDIRPTIDALSNRADLCGFAFRDRYYLGSASNIFVYDEIAKGWSLINFTGADMFLEKDNKIYAIKENKVLELDVDETSDIDSEIRTKDFTFNYDIVQKVFEKIIVYFRKRPASSQVEVAWYINGGTGASGLVTETITSSSVKWDGLYKWDGAVKWSSVTINFQKILKRKLKSGLTISFGVKASGANRFFLNSINVIFDLIKREVH